MNYISEIFGSMVFNDEVMKERLPQVTYKALKRTIQEGKSLNINVAHVVANAMKDWAIEKGATHFTHWFQPMTGITAEKHDSFISATGDGKIIMEFSGKELIKGEPDASSFPSGGLRSTFEARGYTAWDPTSYAFIKDSVLYIPTAFCSYGGEVLDKKTPLLRSMEVLNQQSLRILRLFGDNKTKRVTTTLGPEQEYFLIDKELFNKRKDLIYTGRTLFGAKPPKGQELEDHYFGAIKPRVQEFMKELNNELWKLGIPAKTEHNEVAPAQHELAVVFSNTNLASDHNQLTMELLKRVASKHGLACLLHEKPFAGINGSGKHNNWSLSTNKGINLLEPGTSPRENARFLLFLVAVIKAVDEYQDLLKVSVSTAGNDHRLGGNEAPPAIISVFLGDELASVLESIEGDVAYDKEYKMEMAIGVDAIPVIPKDTTDRNRTSPFAFTGNKFEFRMVGSKLSIAGPNLVLNTIVAEELSQFADILEKADNFNEVLSYLIKDTIKNHKRIIFNGNNYSDEWVKEAEERGLLNLKSTPESLLYFADDKNIRVLEKFGVLSEKEIHSRMDILIEDYCKVLNIEALTMTEMIKKDILPAVSSYIKELCETAASKISFLPDANCDVEKALITRLSLLSSSLYNDTELLGNLLLEVKNCEDIKEAALFYRNSIFSIMQEIRITVDELEVNTAGKYWPYPTYGELLFSV
ncbi:glutamine synthetase III [Sedimentibacter hydroxybenzoicus DSM 7310]|uniref:Glutamine synthetase III n=1 Tax=Sedimentibacter hydroxybenzoicus DSM 7310 TaxID=1123245 RepID=A0A974GXJ4_SEDHY|nr:glutamine synthetase III [Sedimentibacter hydroxybenzoicus]NYB75608.1 glutamine synthetase III [Sedimentibacter hydroxybenzoicus DSM 7310]